MKMTYAIAGGMLSLFSPTAALAVGDLESPKLTSGIVVQGTGLQSSKVSPGVVVQGAAFESAKLSVGIVVQVIPEGGIIPRAPLTHW